MKTYKHYLWVIFSLLFILPSCSDRTKIKGKVEGLEKKEIVVALLGVNTLKILDTLTTGQSGEYEYKMKISPKDPQFVYIFYKNIKLAGLILQNKEECHVVSDTLGNYTVTGSPESEKLVQVEKEESLFKSEIAGKAAKLEGLHSNSEESQKIQKEIAQIYVNYYRSRVKYIMENPKSLTCVNVLCQNVSHGMPVFSQLTDAFHYKNVVDSLKTVYPESMYVRALEVEAERRYNQLMLKDKIDNASEIGFPDISLPDMEGNDVKLSSVKTRVVLLHFWAADAVANMLNTEVLKPLYEKYNSSGFEIYAVSLDTDKAHWATVVKNQNLHWINVCDGLGFASPAARMYNVAKLPESYLILDGVLNTGLSIKNEHELKKFLEKTFQK